MRERAREERREGGLRISNRRGGGRLRTKERERWKEERREGGKEGRRARVGDEEGVGDWEGGKKEEGQ